MVLNKRRIINWFTYTILCALLPMMIAFTVRHILVVKDSIPYNYAGELLLFTVMVAASALGDIKDFRSVTGNDIFLDIFFSAMLILLLVSAILYGCNVVANNGHFDIIDNNGKMLILSGIIGILVAVLGTMVQIIIAKSEVD